MDSLYCLRTNELISRRTSLKEQLTEKILERQTSQYILTKKKTPLETKKILQDKIGILTQQIFNLRQELHSLSSLIKSRSRSKYNGEHHFNSILRTMFGKTRSQLTLAERQQYNAYMHKLKNYKKRKEKKIMTNSTAIKKWFTIFRIENNLTQAQMAKIIGLSPNHISNVENGRDNFTESYYRSFVNAFELSLEQKQQLLSFIVGKKEIPYNRQELEQAYFRAIEYIRHLHAKFNITENEDEPLWEKFFDKDKCRKPSNKRTI